MPQTTAQGLRIAKSQLVPCNVAYIGIAAAHSLHECCGTSCPEVATVTAVLC